MCFTGACKGAGRHSAGCRSSIPSIRTRSRGRRRCMSARTNWKSSGSPNGHAGVEARVERINPAGSVVKIGLVAPEHHEDLSVDLSTVRYAELGLRTGDKVWLSPKRIRVFVPEGADYVILARPRRTAGKACRCNCYKSRRRRIGAAASAPLRFSRQNAACEGKPARWPPPPGECFYDAIAHARRPSWPGVANPRSPPRPSPVNSPYGHREPYEPIVASGMATLARFGSARFSRFDGSVRLAATRLAEPRCGRYPDRAAGPTVESPRPSGDLWSSRVATVGGWLNCRCAPPRPSGSADRVAAGAFPELH